MKRAQNHSKVNINGSPCCRTCQHWYKDDVPKRLEINGTTYTDDRGLCQRYPPVAVVVQNVLKNRQPVTHPAAICGDYLSRH